jgi:hypothetical protein
MKQLTEIRHNPLFIPCGPEKQIKPFHELILIAGRKEYELDMQQQSRQTQKTHVFRCMADEATIMRTALEMLSLLPDQQLTEVADALNEALRKAKDTAE